MDIKPSNAKLLLLFSPVPGKSSHSSFDVDRSLVGLAIILSSVAFDVAG